MKSVHHSAQHLAYTPQTTVQPPTRLVSAVHPRSAEEHLESALLMLRIIRESDAEPWQNERDRETVLARLRMHLGQAADDWRAEQEQKSV